MAWRKVSWVSLGVGMVLAAWAFGVLVAAVGESFPVEHREPITVRVLNGRNGKPLAHLRVALAAGYNEKDLELRLWRDEVVTGAAGAVQVPHGLAEFPFLRVRPLKAKLCQGTARGETYTVERVRSEGLSAPNRCGIVTVAGAPGILVVFVRGGGEPDVPAQASATEPSVDFGGNGPSRQAETDDHRASGPTAAGNEIETLVGRRIGAPEPAAAVEGTGEPAGSYEMMCQPED